MDITPWKPDPDRGYMISQPGRGVGVSTGANATLINRDADKNAEDRQIWMYVTHVGTGWQLAGLKAQTRRSATFYPTNLQQSELMVRGICPNQHEYDKLVHFIRTHQRMTQELSGDRLQRVDFKLLSGLKVNDVRVFPPMYVGGQILNIKAGHERFKFFPVIEFSMKVVEDALDAQQSRGINVANLEANYLATFGGDNGERFYKQTFQIGDFVDLDSAKNVIDNAFDTATDVVDTIQETAGGIWDGFFGGDSDNSAGGGGGGSF